MIKAFYHVGISVESLERAMHFYRDLLEMQVLAEDSFEGEDYERILALKGASGKVALLRAGSFQLELFEYSNPKPHEGNRNRPVCDFGITHFCVEVDDIEAAYRRLSAAGVMFHCAPIDFGGEAKATYGRDPDGNVFEMVERGPPASMTRPLPGCT
jgi:catechol 2,3-dioxygenase-like lactoylglutathione lyase family enzyme